MVNGKKKRLLILSIAVALVCAVAGGAVGLIVGLSRAETYKPFLDVKASEVSLGVERYQKWTFKREDGLWKFSNVSAYDGKKYVPLFTGGADGRFFEVMAGGADSLQLNPDITDFTVEKNAKKDKSIALSGERFTVRLFCDGRTPYVGREITIQSPKTGVVGENEINFCLKTPSETEAGENPIYIEQGYIASWGAEVEQKPLPYSFPAILSEFTAVGSPAKTFQFAQVVDYYRTGEQFKTARRKTDTQSGAVEVGLLGSRAQWETGAAYTVADWFIVRDASSRSFYDLIGDAARQYKAVNPMPLEVLAAKENRSVYEYDAAAAGLAMDIMDDRSLPLGKEGFFSPLAYKGLAGETFGGMDILRGMYQYALYTGDAGVLAYADEMDGSLTENYAFGKSYIEKTVFVPEGLFI
ncbi:MAG: hypothetical protein LBL66_06745, partial [Clostridiales bacterium]|nr:hypothetical protein [Clostridiales bacterium]